MFSPCKKRDLIIFVASILMILASNSQQINQCNFGSYRMTNGQCMQCLSSCSLCSSIFNQCNNCSEGFKFQNSTKQCKPCDIGISNCNTWSVKCQPNYDLRFNKCFPQCKVANCATCKSVASSTCEKCQSSFNLTQLNTKCIPNARLLQVTDQGIIPLKKLDNSTIALPNNRKTNQTNNLNRINGQNSTKSLTTSQRLQPENRVLNISQGISGVKIGQIINKTVSQGVPKITIPIVPILPIPPVNALPATPLRPQQVFPTPLKSTTQTQINCAVGLFFNRQALSNSNDRCLPCFSKCATCINTADQCLECTAGWVKFGWKCVRNQTAVVYLIMNSSQVQSKSNTSNTTNLSNFWVNVDHDLKIFKNKLLTLIYPGQNGTSTQNQSLITINRLKTEAKQINNNQTTLKSNYTRIVELILLIDKVQNISLQNFSNRVKSKLGSTKKIHTFQIGELAVVKSSDSNLTNLQDFVNNFAANPLTFNGIKNQVEPTQPTNSNNKNYLLLILIPIIGGILLLTILGLLICYCKKLCCFEKNNQNVYHVNNQQIGIPVDPNSQRAFPPVNQFNAGTQSALNGQQFPKETNYQDEPNVQKY